MFVSLVLTAGHCCYGSIGISVRLGAYNTDAKISGKRIFEWAIFSRLDMPPEYVEKRMLGLEMYSLDLCIIDLGHNKRELDVIPLPIGMLPAHQEK